ncbi:hypothetical protein [Sulfuriferula nivalis]|uniref:hypothetical protein n=1 Tax=Sulfuriferula nivalis TaxID=2675298 RepID=UPI0013897878|nr:hypothetical protein [Sulfuriferula nivalis]
MFNAYFGDLLVTCLVTTLPVELHAPHGTWRRCFAPEWNDHSGLSRLALHPDVRTLQRVQPPFLG